MYIHFLPGTLPPLYQELQVGWTSTVGATNEVVCSIHSRCASGSASIVEWSWVRRYAMQSPIHSTCCSRAATKFVAADGLPGACTMNRFGNPATDSPRYERGPSV